MTSPPGEGDPPPAPRVVAELAALQEPVEIHRDSWGIAHLRARSVADLFVGQGYVHAQDRLWQMDAGRRQMQGRWAQWVGESGIEADRLARRLGVTAASIRDYEALGAPARGMVDSYAAGVNAFIAQAARLPLEYRLLDASPEPWQGWHCILAMRQRGYLMGSLWFKLWRAAALGVVAAEDIAKLRYDDDGADRLCIPPGADAQRWMATVGDLRPSIEALALLGQADSSGGGSNNWALAGSRTSTGRPLLAGDPHRAFELPGMYAQMHLACEEFDAIGFTVPGVPAFPHFAHNGQVAWCVTHAFADIHDLFVERFDPEDATRYLYKGNWQDALIRVEHIAVRGAPSVPVEIVETMHGPVVAGAASSGAALTLRSIQFADTDHSFDGLLPMLRADSCDALFEATRGWGLIDHNLVAADAGGHIAHLVRAVVPRRPRLNGWLPVPGWTGEYDWAGVIPWEQMPRVDDPTRGFLVTANNRVVSSIPATGDYFCTDAHPPYRARRIEDLLSALGKASPEDMQQIHRDDLSVAARLFQARLAAIAPADPDARALRELVVGWDARMSPDSVAAACYAELRWALARMVAARSGLRATASDELCQLPPGVSPASQLWWILPTLMRTDDVCLLGGWTWDQALERALTIVAEQFGFMPWGERHRAILTHPLASVFPEAASTLNPAGAQVGGDNETVWANGSRAVSGTDAVYGAVARYVFDVGNWAGCAWIVLGGASGDPESPHYLDQHGTWSKCELVPMLYDWDVIASAGTVSTLQPALGARPSGPGHRTP